jgi:hypothetical protein
MVSGGHEAMSHELARIKQAMTDGEHTDGDLAYAVEQWEAALTKLSSCQEELRHNTGEAIRAIDEVRVLRSRLRQFDTAILQFNEGQIDEVELLSRIRRASAVEKQRPDHVCGAQGFGRHSIGDGYYDDECPACNYKPDAAPERQEPIEPTDAQLAAEVGRIYRHMTKGHPSE